MSGHQQVSRASAFLRAAYEGKVAVVLHMLDKEGVPADACNQTGLQAIHFAAKTANVELAAELIKRGAEVNAATLKGNTPLHVAALMGHTEVVKLLLRNGADVNLKSDCYGDYFTPLYMAAQIGNQEIVTLLLANGADPTIQTKNGSLPRDVAMQQNHKVVAELLLEYEKRTAASSGVSSDNSGDEQSDESADSAVEASSSNHQRRKVGPPPVCQDVTASPRNSPKRFPRKTNGDALTNGDQT